MKLMQIVNYVPRFMIFSWTVSLELYFIKLGIFVTETIFRNAKFLPRAFENKFRLEKKNISRAVQF
jgi:hypothetical protein